MMGMLRRRFGFLPSSVRLPGDAAAEEGHVRGSLLFLSLSPFLRFPRLRRSSLILFRVFANSSSHAVHTTELSYVRYAFLVRLKVTLDVLLCCLCLLLLLLQACNNLLSVRYDVFIMCVVQFR